MTPVDEELVLTFRKPIVLKAGDEVKEYREVTLREPQALELDKALRCDTHIGSMITMIHLVGTIPLAVAQKIGQRDIAIASTFFAAFGAGPEAGEDGQS